MKQVKTWQDCVAFHGHECGGLTIGYKAALYAIELLDLEFSDDEQVVCISENDACGVDFDNRLARIDGGFNFRVRLR